MKYLLYALIASDVIIILVIFFCPARLPGRRLYAVAKQLRNGSGKRPRDRFARDIAKLADQVEYLTDIVERRFDTVPDGDLEWMLLRLRGENDESAALRLLNLHLDRPP